VCRWKQGCGGGRGGALAHSRGAVLVPESVPGTRAGTRVCAWYQSWYQSLCLVPELVPESGTRVCVGTRRVPASGRAPARVPVQCGRSPANAIQHICTLPRAHGRRRPGPLRAARRPAAVPLQRHVHPARAISALRRARRRYLAVGRLRWCGRERAVGARQHPSFIPPEDIEPLGEPALRARMIDAFFCHRSLSLNLRLFVIKRTFLSCPLPGWHETVCGRGGCEPPTSATARARARGPTARCRKAPRPTAPPRRARAAHSAATPRRSPLPQVAALVRRTLPPCVRAALPGGTVATKVNSPPLTGSREEKRGMNPQFRMETRGTVRGGGRARAATRDARGAEERCPAAPRHVGAREREERQPHPQRVEPRHLQRDPH
jgi:hypothetical protein